MRAVLRNPVVGALASLSATGIAAALLLPPALPAPAITQPVSIAATFARTPHAIERRIFEMTPNLRFAAPPPALPGSIQFAAFSLPAIPPDIPYRPPTPIATIALPPPAIMVPGTPPTISPPVDVAALHNTERPAPLIGPSASLPPYLADDLADRGRPTNREPIAAPPQVALPAPDTTAPAQCRPPLVTEAPVETPSREMFGPALAAAALKQTEQFVVYDARYTRIAYPGGDVSASLGVCTDVIIRAYRTLGIDLQRLVVEARLGSGDTSIDHRRTEVLRRFFATHGETLLVSDDASDYLPGDIITYYRPQNRLSTSHIAVVSDVLAPSGRPMIIHNRGLGVQLEDALFVDRITGHYRYAGPQTPLPPMTVAARPLPPKRPSPVTLAATVTRAPQGTVSVRGAAKSPAANKLWPRYANTPRTSQ